MSTSIDPRIAATTIVDGPPDLVGKEVYPVDTVRVGGRLVDFPRVLPGAAEYASVVSSETRAESLRPRLVGDLPYARGRDVPLQQDGVLVIEMQAAAATAVTSAIEGLSRFATYHVDGRVGSGTFVLGDAPRTARELRELPIHEMYADVLPELMGVGRPTGERWWQTFRTVQGLAALRRHAVYEPVRRSGLQGERPLLERFYNGEYRGVAWMMLAAFEHFSPGWISQARLDQLGRPPS